jgi:leucyl-tRNA synthetase
MMGKNVLYPIGWDAFGLPTENYAIKTGLPPSVVTKQNTKNFERQLRALGFSFDWSRVVDTTDPEYYKWTQWIFLQFLKQGLAYRDTISINWCPKDKIGLANEEVIAGCCERCGTKVEKRVKEQWMLAITKYADRLDADLDTVDYPPQVKAQQRNWIGKSDGAEIDFRICAEGEVPQRWPAPGTEHIATVFTTRPETLFGVTYIVLAPEHALVSTLQPKITNWEEVSAYVAAIADIDEAERTSALKKKTGVQLQGVCASHPVTGEALPVWIADYVLATYGTGAVMAVPAHDERDREFAEAYHLEVREVIDPATSTLINSGEFTGTKASIASALITHAHGRATRKYKLRDWVFSRQRYWGEPIPVVHCKVCGVVPLPEKDLPLLLPRVKQYEPTDTSESPLASIASWVNTHCPRCKGPAKRETDTMPNWAGSSWYYLRYTDPKNTKSFAHREKIDYWTPVNWYNGGMEHTTLHLLYSRFWHKFLFDQKLVPTSEPYAKRTSHGLIMASDGTKMSKSKGNSVSPDEVLATYGADTLRLYEMFIGPFEQAVAWNSDGLIGPRRFIERVYRFFARIQSQMSSKGSLSPEGYTLLHRTIKKVGEDIDQLAMNTAVSSLMILLNQLEKEPHIARDEAMQFLTILAPFIPFVAEEIHEQLGGKKSVGLLPWPAFDPAALIEQDVHIAIQVNGKVRATLTIDRESAGNQEIVLKHVLELPSIRERVGDNPPHKVIYVPYKLINIVYVNL